MMALKGLLSFSRKMVGGVDFLIRAFIATFIAAMLVVICIQVFFRFVLNNALPWPEELARFTMIWSSLLAAAYVQLERGHLSMDFFILKLPEKVSITIRIIMDSAIMAFLVVTFYAGIQEAYTLMSLKTGALRVSRAVPYLAIPVSTGLFILATILLIIKGIRQLRQ